MRRVRTGRLGSGREGGVKKYGKYFFRSLARKLDGKRHLAPWRRWIWALLTGLAGRAFEVLWVALYCVKVSLKLRVAVARRPIFANLKHITSRLWKMHNDNWQNKQMCIAWIFKCLVLYYCHSDSSHYCSTFLQLPPFALCEWGHLLFIIRILAKP